MATRTAPVTGESGSATSVGQLRGHQVGPGREPVEFGQLQVVVTGTEHHEHSHDATGGSPSDLRLRHAPARGPRSRPVRPPPAAADGTMTGNDCSSRTTTALAADHPLVDGRTAHAPLIRAYRGQPTGRHPVWFMRQAGRSLPEYRKVRAGTGMLEACLTPELAAEITLQPVRRHGVDAAILFSDIVVPLQTGRGRRGDRPRHRAGGGRPGPHRRRRRRAAHPGPGRAGADHRRGRRAGRRARAGRR